jgi:hypothetical protein
MADNNQLGGNMLTEKDKLWYFIKEELSELKNNLSQDNIELYYQCHGWSSEHIVMCIDNTKDWLLSPNMITIQMQCPDCESVFDADDTGMVEEILKTHKCL